MNLIKNLAASAVLGALVITTGCAGVERKNASIPIMEVTTKLRRSDYIVLGTATGQSCAEESCNILFGCTKKASTPGDELLSVLRDDTAGSVQQSFLMTLLGAAPAVVPSRSQVAEAIATYKAIESYQDADAILSLRFETETTEENFLGLTSNVKSCVTAKGKAIHVKSDAEMAAGK
ncbi:MAG: hypothetical protein Q8O67_28510 [Deltaproteobacteria bacterium]|nr:hypothetical protein [Deltaproteobacteria bacterium]